MDTGFEKPDDPDISGLPGLAQKNIGELRFLLFERPGRIENILTALEKTGSIDLAVLPVLCALSLGKSPVLSSGPAPFMKAVMEAGLCGYVRCNNNCALTGCGRN